MKSLHVVGVAARPVSDLLRLCARQLLTPGETEPTGSLPTTDFGSEAASGMGRRRRTRAREGRANLEDGPRLRHGYSVVVVRRGTILSA